MNNVLSRRNFLMKTSTSLAGFSAVTSIGSTSFYIAACTKGAKKDNSSIYKISCEFGIEGGFPQNDDVKIMPFLKAIRELGAEFIIVIFIPDSVNSTPSDRGWKGREQDFKDLALACREFNLTYFVNQEITNFYKPGTFLDKDGNDMLAHPDKTHRWDITGEVLESALKYPEFRGVLYDESEHGQMRLDYENADYRPFIGLCNPYYAVTNGMTIVEAYEAVYNSASAIVRNYRDNGVTPMTESVFPAMLFTFARAGFDPAIKFMKEGIDPVYGAIAMGAARQYGRELCITPDLWGMTGFPGHPPEEMRASFLYAYWIGATKIFVEDAGGLLEKKIENDIISYEPNEYGKVYQWIVKEHIPAHPRPYTFRDIRPEVAILRLDDSCWGQKGSWLPDCLYGAENLKTTPETAAWFQIWKLLTHGRTLEEGLNYHNLAYNYGKLYEIMKSEYNYGKHVEYNGMPHDFFCPLNGVIVYDHLAGEKELEGLKLVFLTGVLISPQTLIEVKKFVEKGGLCISLASLAPSEFKGKLGEIPDGSGRWLIVEDFDSDEVRKAVAPFLGKPDEISYNVGDKKLTVKRGENNNTIRIYLQNIKEIMKDGETSESARIL